MRKRIYEIIEKSNGNDIYSTIYDYFMMLMIAISVIPLVFKDNYPIFLITDRITMFIFIADYLLRLGTADLKYESKSIKSFLRYPFSFMAIVDLVAILPALLFHHSNIWRFTKVLRMLRALRVVRLFKSIRYSKSFKIIGDVLNDSKESLLAVCVLAIGYIILSAMIIFSVEPDSFENFFEAVYWSTISLTTVGYGDVYPISMIGRIVAMISSLFGIAIVALPAGIITAEYMKKLSTDTESE